MELVLIAFLFFPFFLPASFTSCIMIQTYFLGINNMEEMLTEIFQVQFKEENGERIQSKSLITIRDEYISSNQAVMSDNNLIFLTRDSTFNQKLNVLNIRNGDLKVLNHPAVYQFGVVGLSIRNKIVYVLGSKKQKEKDDDDDDDDEGVMCIFETSLASEETICLRLDDKIYHDGHQIIGFTATENLFYIYNDLLESLFLLNATGEIVYRLNNIDTRQLVSDKHNSIFIKFDNFTHYRLGKVNENGEIKQFDELDPILPWLTYQICTYNYKRNYFEVLSDNFLFKIDTENGELIGNYTLENTLSIHFIVSYFEKTNNLFILFICIFMTLALILFSVFVIFFCVCMRMVVQLCRIQKIDHDDYEDINESINDSIEEIVTSRITEIDKKYGSLEESI